jgi:hypothetical protein
MPRKRQRWGPTLRARRSTSTVTPMMAAADPGATERGSTEDSRSGLGGCSCGRKTEIRAAAPRDHPSHCRIDGRQSVVL